eukprot:733794-Pelagomonas_calceolata.AAC.1
MTCLRYQRRGFLTGSNLKEVTTMTYFSGIGATTEGVGPKESKEPTGIEPKEPKKSRTGQKLY